MHPQGMRETQSVREEHVEPERQPRSTQGFGFQLNARELLVILWSYNYIKYFTYIFIISPPCFSESIITNKKWFAPERVKPKWEKKVQKHIEEENKENIHWEPQMTCFFVLWASPGYSRSREQRDNFYSFVVSWKKISFSGEENFFSVTQEILR